MWITIPDHQVWWGDEVKREMIIKHVERSSGTNWTGRKKRKEWSYNKILIFYKKSLNLIKMDLSYSLKYMVGVQKELREWWKILRNNEARSA